MNLEQAKILTEKINALLRSMSVTPENIATIEKDLMRSYIRQLYEAFMDDLPASKTSVPATPVVEIRPEPVKEPAPAVAKPKPEPKPSLDDTPPPFEEVRERMQTKRPEILPVEEEEDILEITNEMSKSEPAPPPLPEPVKIETPKKPVRISPDLEELFESEGVKELSDKLSQLPIPDLNKAFGLNEKIFTINELFGGNQSLFTDLIRRLNLLPDFDNAKELLCLEAAEPYDWAHKDRKKKAKEFIKIVRRRFS